jgi:MoaA/NifB/PqqE/SkfB family radical SAM enzyme/ubiquinone/menaquinone biosynthesis C-methylase UbiE
MFEEWQRLEQNGIPVYVQPEKPDWFVPDHEADTLLQELQQGKDPGAFSGPERSERMLTAQRLVSRLEGGVVSPYKGRYPLLTLNSLQECWFHLTDRCNLACRHCLFSASPAQGATLSPEALAQGISEAKGLGCTLFYFTGGEPFVYPGFVTMVAELLKDPQVHVVVLSNGLLIKEHLDALASLPRDRFHLQLSLDGLAEQHEALRGKTTFAALLESLGLLTEAGFPLTLSVAVNRANVGDLAEIVVLAASQGISNIHLLWHFVRGKGSREQFVAPAVILPELIRAQEMAEKMGVRIDNVETLRSQVFSTPGTRHDLSNTAWESLAVGPDGVIYPSPALVGMADLACGPLADGLETVWRRSPVLEKIRKATLAASEGYQANPLRFLVGGGDLDHSYLAGGELVDHDPYVDLYNGLALWLISRQAGQYPVRTQGEILLRMGEVRYDCPDGGHEVALTHCNCVVSLADGQGHATVREFYGRAALTANEEIVNPFAPDQALANFIPADSRKKSYGCGSPVKDAEPHPGEVLVDLGSGSGVECFMAAAKVGPSGRVIGIDMTEEMLHLARVAKATVASRLGYDNVEFKKGFLEEIPLPDATADVVISNCVINLSPDKRQTLHEIFRILKPGGRLVVSDIVTDHPIPVAIKNNAQFRGECLGGALRQEDLLGMLRSAGFAGASLVKRFPYRIEGETRFYSLTFQAHKPEAMVRVEVIYRGPFGAVWTESGTMLLKGRRATVTLSEAESLADSLFLLDAQGGVANLALENSCCASPAGVEPLPASGCCSGPEGGAGKIVALPSQLKPPTPIGTRHPSGCMVCGKEVGYLAQEREVPCHYCGGVKKTNALCVEGHYICDSCHQQDGLSAIRLLCAETKEQDMLLLLNTIRSHPAIPLHGPEHHAMVPGIILATYRNLGGRISREAILTGIERGSKVPGGVCGFWGNCGAAAGVGIAFSVLLEATPLTPKARQQVQEVTSRVLGEIAHTQGARCCQRETVTALREAAFLSHQLLPISLLAEADFFCKQFSVNRECIGGQCPLWDKAELQAGGAQ